MADNNNRASQLAAILSAVGAAGGWAAYLKANSVANSGGQLVIPSSLMDLLSAWAQTTDDISTVVAQILAALPTLGGGTIPVTVQGFPINADQVESGQMSVSTTLPTSLPNLLIPDDFAINVKAFAGNPAGSYILVSGSKSGASGLATAYPLALNDSISYRVKNASSIWVMATIGPAYINWTVEQRSS
jgi:hypothetical protein